MYVIEKFVKTTGTLKPHYNAVSGVQYPIRIITDPALYRNALTGLLGPASASGTGTICALSELPPSAFPLLVAGFI